MKQKKVLLNIVTIVGLVIVIILTRHQFAQVFFHLNRVKLIPLLLLAPFEVCNFYSGAMMYQEYLLVIGERVSLWELVKASFELNFVNLVFPTGGVSGFSYFSLRLRPLGISTAKTTMVQGARFALMFITYIPLLIIGMLSLAITGRANSLTILVGSSITTITLIGTVLMIYIVSDRKRIKGAAVLLPHAINFVASLIGRKREVISIAKVERVFDEFHEDYVSITRDLSQLRKTIFWSLMINVTELVVIYTAIVANGRWVNPGAVILAYAVANFAGAISAFGGLGVYEFLMTTIMASAGVPAAIALSATVMYRIFNMVVFVPIGYFFYRGFLRKNNAL
jgi:uncharacterized protein (TIRG00374 family)